MNPVIREELPSDAAAIHAVTAAAFLNAPHTAHTEQFIVEALRKAGALTISLVAERGGEVVGHVALSPVSISDGSTGWFGLGPVSSCKPRFGFKPEPSLVLPGVRSEYFQALLFGSSLPHGVVTFHEAFSAWS